jgi:hypothetical protein
MTPRSAREEKTLERGNTTLGRAILFKRIWLPETETADCEMTREVKDHATKPVATNRGYGVSPVGIAATRRM